MKTNLVPLFLSVSLAFFPLYSIAATADNNTATSAPAASSSAPTNTADAQRQDGKIIEMITVIDNNEINEANEALKRSSNDGVKDFAQTMVKDHSQNLQDAKDLSQKINIQLVTSDKSQALTQKGKQGLQKLSNLPEKRFDMAYINAMVVGHTAVLKAIDEQLLPKASNADLVSFLKTTRETVQHHLDMAKDIQKQLNDSKSA